MFLKALNALRREALLIKRVVPVDIDLGCFLISFLPSVEGDGEVGFLLISVFILFHFVHTHIYARVYRV